MSGLMHAYSAMFCGIWFGTAFSLWGDRLHLGAASVCLGVLLSHLTGLLLRRLRKPRRCVAREAQS